jgi:hypothetical protein
MTHNEFTRRYPNASESTIRRNCPGDLGPDTKLESGSVHEPLAAAQAKAQDSKRVLVRVTSVRKRLLDEDNLCEKFHIDCCRYAGLIRDDNPAATKIEVNQRKARKNEAERTIIEIIRP